MSGRTLFRNSKGRETTRHREEVQDVDPSAFALKLQSVFSECHRVLKDDGLLVFSYHHSKEDGWSSIAQAVVGAGFALVESQPVKAEMSVAAPKSQAQSPIDLDILMVCRKQAADTRNARSAHEALARANELAEEKVKKFNAASRELSRNDAQVVFISQLLVELSSGRAEAALLHDLRIILPQVQSHIDRVFQSQQVHVKKSSSIGMLWDSLE